MDAPTKGLKAILQQLPANKAIAALRIQGLGRQPLLADFKRKGMPLSVAEAVVLEQWLLHGMHTKVVENVKSADGTQRLLIGLKDGRRVETVAMPSGTVCVSTQVGCAVGCRFCASGLFGVERNLTADEITEQVVHARRQMKIGRVVYMGMGEPSHNLEAVLQAVADIKHVAQIGPRRQTVSTVGSVRTFLLMLQAPVQPCLAVSLHTADDARRRELMPRAHKDLLVDIVRGADEYARATGNPVQFEWTLLDGVNDRDEDADGLIALLRGVHGLVNFIVWNPVAGMPFQAPPRDRIVALVRRVKKGGVHATIRDSSGPDAGAACGQLRLRDRAAPG
ncbi:putative RNA methyltransferase [Planctomycetota bacterium]|nr:putative RNA methyltransferase [Planctomycetota bacterium]